MSRRWLMALVLATACKTYEEPKKLDQACKTDKDCEEPLLCRDGLRATRVCVKTCGANKFGTDPSHLGIGQPDNSCPPGWECAAMLEQRLVDKQTKEDKGAAWGGMGDQPICVPKGWTPTPK